MRPPAGSRPGGGAPAGEVRPREPEQALNRRWWRVSLGAVLIGALAYLALEVVVPSEWVTLAPGPAPDVATLVTPLTGPRAGGGETAAVGRGRLVLTTVRAARATPDELWKAVTRDEVEIVARDYLIPRGMDDRTYEVWAAGAMRESQSAAAQQAWLALGREARLTADGARVIWVSRWSPAGGRLQAGDVIRSWSLGDRTGVYLTSGQFERELRAAFFRAGGGLRPARLELDVRREDRAVRVQVQLKAADLSSWPFLGLALAAENLRTDPPLPLTFPPGDIGGPSGGLMLALQIIDDFTPGDLTGGRIVAGSGTIGPDGVIGPVGGIELKLRAAAGVGAEVFLVPSGDFEQAQAAVERLGLSLICVPVSDLTEAWKKLEGASLTSERRAAYNGPDLGRRVAAAGRVLIC